MPDALTALSNVARVLENRFFYSENRVLAEELERLKKNEETVEAIAQASNITDKAVLRELVRLGVRPETVTALCLVPVVEVAWADGTIDAREIEAFVKGARKNGAEARLKILNEWLRHKPDEAVVQAWKQYMKGLCGIMDAQAHSLLCDDIINHAQEVAKSSGGFLGLIDPISPEENQKLEEMRTFLRHDLICR